MCVIESLFTTTAINVFGPLAVVTTATSLFQLPPEVIQAQLEKERRQLQLEEGQQSRYASQMSNQIYKEAQVGTCKSPGLLSCLYTVMLGFGFGILFNVGRPLALKDTFQDTHHTQINTTTKHVHIAIADNV